MRLVDIDDIRVMKFLSEEDDPSESDGEREYRNGWNDALTAINDIQPSAEPEIIRCKDCKYASPNGEYGCKAYHFKLYETHEMKADDFCSKAERRTDE